MSATLARVHIRLADAPAALMRSGVGSAYLAECRKLASQLPVRLLALLCLVAPFLFGAVLKVQMGSPSDTLYGAWVHSSGIALSLVALSFAGSWGLPVVIGIGCGDIFSSEDRYGTWKLVLARSCTRGQLFCGKVLAAGTLTLGLLVVTAGASLASGAAFIGEHPLVSLTGTLISPGSGVLLVALGWLTCALPALAYASLSILLSVATRNGILGVIGPGLAALAMQLLMLFGTGAWAHMLLLSSAFLTWPAFFTGNPFYGPLVVGLMVSLVWIVVCLGASWLIVRRRDFAGTPGGGRAGWLAPLRLAAMLLAIVVLFAFGSNWGPPGITPARVKASFVPTFNRLALYQQRELGRRVPRGAQLNIVLTSCTRRASKPSGPGQWTCSLNVLIPAPGSLPPQPTPIAYDLSISSNGCYKAESPPAIIGPQFFRDAKGREVINPLFTIYGCFNTL